MITDVEGVRVGHWSDPDAQTGCTVVLLPEGTVASGEIRGGAPATREFALLDPARMVQHVDAVLLTGGSAFGLAAAEGVVQFCEAAGRGFATRAGPVPIVVAMGLFDLGVGDASVRPGAAEGLAACRNASTGHVSVGRIGAGTGATVSKWHDPDRARPGGLVTASLRRGDLVVAALVAVNAVGDVDDGQRPGVAPQDIPDLERSGHGNTTIGVIATNATLDKGQCQLVAQAGHDGLARSLLPAHSLGDGDALVAAAVGGVDVAVGIVRTMAVTAVASAVRSLGAV